MLTPRMGQTPPDGMPWAADSGRFASPQDYADETYLAWLSRMVPYQARCLFATAPDVVGDAAETLAMSAPMYAPIRALGYKVALVAQDGLEDLPVPWDDFDCLFIGGTTEWKLSEPAYALVAEAKRRGKWTHMGRVNSLRRLRAAHSAGIDSADGTFIKFGPNQNEARMRRWLASLIDEPVIWATAGLGEEEPHGQ